MAEPLLSVSIDLLLNLTLLIALSILSAFLEKRLSKTSLSGALAQGVLFGVTAVLGMMRHLVLGPGLIFDGRSVMLGLCGMFFGYRSALVAVILTSTYRLFLGGTGTMMGILVILSSAGIGLAARARLKPDETPPAPRQLYVFGLLVHAVMLALSFTLPGGEGLSVIRRIGLPIIILYPLATVLAGKILSDQVAARKTLAALLKSEERFKLSMEASNDGLWDWEVKTDDAYYNPAYYRILGYRPGEFPGSGKSWEALLHPDDRDRALNANRECISGEKEYIESEFRMRAKNGEWRWIFSRGKCIRRDDRGRAIRLVGTHVDITERKKAEEQTLRSLREKEVLLREVHHRVKNNLSIISSLLSLQSSMIRSPEDAMAAFQNSRERILAMSLVHEELYKSMDYTQVGMSDYLGKLLAQLSIVYGHNDRIQLEFNAGSVVLDVDAAIPCGLILNELITNSFKYAFPAPRAGLIRVDLQRLPEGLIELTVTDDGVGMALNGNAGRNGSLGLTLVRLLVEQLKGTLEIDAAEGTRFCIRFSAPMDAP